MLPRPNQTKPYRLIRNGDGKLIRPHSTHNYEKYYEKNLDIAKKNNCSIEKCQRNFLASCGSTYKYFLI